MAKKGLGYNTPACTNSRQISDPHPHPAQNLLSPFAVQFPQEERTSKFRSFGSFLFLYFPRKAVTKAKFSKFCQGGWGSEIGGGQILGQNDPEDGVRTNKSSGDFFSSLILGSSERENTRKSSLLSEESH